MRRRADAASPSGDRPVAVGWFASLPGVVSLGDAALALPGLRRLPHGVIRWTVTHRPLRGVVLFVTSVRHPAICLTRDERGFGTLVTLRALLGRRRKVVVLGYVIHARRHPLRRLIARWDRWAIHRALLRAQVYARSDRAVLSARYRLEPERWRYVPWAPPHGMPDDLPALPPAPMVFCGGRAACDWPTMFAAAQRGNWPLTVVCSAKQRRLVARLNAGGRAHVNVEVPRSDWDALLARSTVLALAMEDSSLSQGHTRVLEAAAAGIPLVATDVPALGDYVGDGETALLVAPRDPVALADAIARLLADPALGERLRRAALSRARAWTWSDYERALGAVINDDGALDGGSEHR